MRNGIGVEHRYRIDIYAVESGEVVECPECGEWWHIDDLMETENGGITCHGCETENASELWRTVTMDEYLREMYGTE